MVSPPSLSCFRGWSFADGPRPGFADAEAFKTNDEAFSKKFEAKQQLESYIGRVEEIVSDPTLSLKLKRGQKEKIESSISDAMAALELNESTADDLKKQELTLKRLVTKAMASR